MPWGVHSGMGIKLAQPFTDELHKASFVDLSLHKHDPLLQVSDETHKLWRRIQSELFSLQEDRFLIAKVLFPPYLVVDKKLCTKFNKAYKRNVKAAKMEVKVEELQERLRLLTTNTSLKSRMAMLKIDVQTDDAISYEKLERRREIAEKKVEREELDKQKAKGGNKTTSKKTKQELALERRQRAEEQVAKDASEADKLYILISQVKESGNLQKMIHDSLAIFDGQNTFDANNDDQQNNNQKNEKTNVVVCNPDNNQNNNDNNDNFIVLGSRSRLMKHSAIIQEKVKKNDFIEVYHVGRPTSTILISPDNKVNTRNGANVYGYYKQSVLTHFEKYTKRDMVRNNELRVKHELEELQNVEIESTGVEGCLKNEESERIKMLKELEIKHKQHIMNILDKQMEEDIRRIRINHLQAVEIETKKIENRFSQYYTELNEFYVSESDNLKQYITKYHEHKIEIMERKLKLATEERENIIPLSLVPELLALSNELKAEKLIEDCKSLLVENIRDMTERVCLYCPVLLETNSARKLFADCTDMNLIALQKHYTWDEWHDQIMRIYNSTKDIRIRTIIQHFQNSKDIHLLIEDLQRLLYSIFNTQALEMEKNGIITTDENKLTKIITNVLAFAHAFRFTELEKSQRDKAFQLKITQKDAFRLSDLYSILSGKHTDTSGRKMTIDSIQEKLIKHEIRVREESFENLKVEFRDSKHVHIFQDHVGARFTFSKAFRYITFHSLFALHRLFPTVSEDMLRKEQLHDSNMDIKTTIMQVNKPSQKWYYEVTIGPMMSDKTVILIGWDVDHPDGNIVKTRNYDNSPPFTCELPINSISVLDSNQEVHRPTGCLWQNNGIIFHNGEMFQCGISYTTDDVIGTAYDQTNEKYYFFKNGKVFICRNIENTEYNNIKQNINNQNQKNNINNLNNNQKNNINNLNNNQNTNLNNNHNTGINNFEGYLVNDINSKDRIGYYEQDSVFENSFISPINTNDATSHVKTNIIYPITLNIDIFLRLDESLQMLFSADSVCKAKPVHYHNTHTKKIFKNFQSLKELTKIALSERQSNNSSPGDGDDTLYINKEKNKHITTFGSDFKLYDNDANDNDNNNENDKNNGEDFSLRPCISCYQTCYNPCVTVYLNFRGPFKYSMKGYDSLLHVLNEEQDDME